MALNEPTPIKWMLKMQFSASRNLRRRRYCKDDDAIFRWDMLTYVTRVRLDVIFDIPFAIDVLCRGSFSFIANVLLVSSIMDMSDTERGSNPMSGVE